MRQNIINWIQDCVFIILNEFQENDNATMLVKTFVSQYELNALRLQENDDTAGFSNTYKYVKQKLRSSLLPTKSREINFSGEATRLDVFFWPFQKMHLDYQVEIYNNLRLENRLKLGIFSHNQPTANHIIEMNIEGTIHLIDNHPVWVDYKKLAFFKDLMFTIKKLPKLKLKDRDIQFGDIFLMSMNAWYWLYDYTIRIFNKIVEKYNPRSIFVGNSITLVGNIIGHLAEKRNIRTVCIMHGRLNEYLEFSKFDYFYLFGEKDKQKILKKGIPESKLIVSGSPRIDSFFNKKKQGTSKNEIVILVALSGPGHSITVQHHIETLKVLFVAAKRFPELKFYFKLHRKDHVDYYQELDALANTSIIKYGDLTVSENIYDWISESEMLITGASTSALDAMLMKCPVITIDLMGHLSDVDFISERISIHSKNEDELILNINKLLLKGKFFNDHLEIAEEYLKDIYSQPIEGSSNLIKNHIKSIL